MKLETERLLADHLYNLSQHEKMIESRRLDLCEHFRFHPHAAFKRIDRLNNSIISSLDLATFLKENGFNFFSVDMYDVIAQYDRDNDGHLNIEEFSNLIVTNTDTILGRRSFDRYEEYVGFSDRLPNEIEAMMCGIIISEVEGLKILNRERELLKSRYDFSRLDAFRAIDNYKLNSLLRDDLKYFLNRNGIHATALDVDHLFQRLDRDKDGRITYTEFCDYIEKVGSNMQQLSKKNIYTKTVDQALENHKQDQMKQQERELLHQKQNTDKQKHHYQTPKRLQGNQDQIDYKQNPRFVETDERFYQKTQRQQVDEDTNPLIEDEQRRNFINFGIREQYSTPLRKSHSPKPINNQSSQDKQFAKQQNKLTRSNDAQSQRKQQSKNNYLSNDSVNSKNHLASLATTPSPTKNQNLHSQVTNNDLMASQNAMGYLDGRKLDLDDIEEEDNNFDNSQGLINNQLQQQDNFKSGQYINIDDEQQEEFSNEHLQEQNQQNSNEYDYQQVSPFQRNHYLEPSEEANLAEALINTINLETLLEKQKQSLALKADFNLLDAFRLFDRSIAGEIYKHDLEEGFKKLGVYSINKKELDLFFKRNDKNQDYKLRYLEFTDAFTPRDRIYADHLSNKRPNYEARHPDEAITLKTRLEFGDALRNIMRYESNLEDIRVQLTQSPQFSISSAFQTLDQDNKGFVVQSDLKEFLESYEFFATEKEIDLIFEKIDKDRDGKISYGEFFVEIAPKLSSQLAY